MEMTREEARATERELDPYFAKLALDEAASHKYNKAGEKGCRLLRALRSALSEWERLEKEVEKLERIKSE